MLSILGTAVFSTMALSLNHISSQGPLLFYKLPLSNLELPSVTHHSWILSPSTPPCLHTLPHTGPLRTGIFKKVHSQRTEVNIGWKSTQVNNWQRQFEIFWRDFVSRGGWIGATLTPARTSCSLWIGSNLERPWEPPLYITLVFQWVKVDCNYSYSSWDKRIRKNQLNFLLSVLLQHQPKYPGRSFSYWQI